jgi:hypothetical protein
MSKELQKNTQGALVRAAAITPMDLIAKALEEDVSMDKIERLLDLKDRWEKTEAEKAYNEAIAQFKTENVKISKDGTVDFTSAKGRTYYRFETLASVVNTVVPLLAKYGLNHSWRTAQGDSGQVKVSCKLAHAKGHSEEISLHASPDNSGNKNPIQAIKSTVSYLQRITLTSILGLAAGDQDDDARGAHAQTADPVNYINESEAANIHALIDEINVDEHGFLAWMQVSSVEKIPKDQLQKAITALENRRG